MHGRLESWRDITIACPPVPLVLPDELLDSSNFASLKTGTRSRHPTRGAMLMPNAALSQKLKPSPKLAEILGSSQPLSRADAVKELLDYFKEHNLHDPKNKREIRSDAQLRPLFGKDRITMFEVGRIVNSNLKGGNSSKKPPKKAA
jgi:chromatin remodeling complex protein RSC6